jgi:signal transduction histidine kinase/AraC-like DNA-binding protein
MPTKILVVDDEEQLQVLMQQRFRRRIQAGDYSFRFATNGLEALEALQADPDVDVLLLDINMPGMSGLTLLGHLPDVVPLSRAVMVSAYGDLTNVRTAMNRGAFDFVMKPINFEDLELTIGKTALHVGQLRESVRVKAVADLKARFFDNITHEFRTPLSLILAPVDALLERPQPDAATHRGLLTVRRNARQLLTLTNQLLDLARLEADGLPTTAVQADAVAFWQSLTDSFGELAEQKELTLTFTTNVPEQPGTFDADKWQKIGANLLANALKFTPAGGQVRVGYVAGNDSITLTIADTGIGIAPDDLPRIFDRFYQVDASPTRAYEGSGIGLALAYELARWLGGQLTATSELGRGTTFTLVLPIGPPTGAEPHNIPVTEVDTWLPATLLHRDTTESDADLPLVLLVEDNAELLAFMGESLVGTYRVLTATNGHEGLLLAQRELPDVVISDVMMPEMDGFELTRRLRADPTTDHIAVVMLTARAAPDSRHEGLHTGADDYLTKPFDLAELRLRLHNLTQRQQKLRAHYQRQLGRAGNVPTADAPASTPADAFLSRLHAEVEAHLDDTTFDVPALAEAMAMSTQTLTRKLATLAGIGPARLIRTYRLRRATDLLRAGRTVSETAWLVGFEHPNNFATAFKELFGQTPSEYAAASRGAA